MPSTPTPDLLAIPGERREVSTVRADGTPAPTISVVVPVRDGGAPFRECLAALVRCRQELEDLIVVDDGSQDDSAVLAEQAGAVVVRTRGGEGPGAARNLGARHARGSWLVFIDADCVPHPDTVRRIAETIRANPGISALFGSYDDRPAAPGFVSQYKNLMHHFVHQHGRREAATFWAGCGAVRRDVFLAIGGFDTALFSRPSIEDIELGYRLRDAGHRILLVGDVQVTHHKRWTLRTLLRTDLFDRAIPWARLNARRDAAMDDLNLSWRQRVSGALAGVAILALPVAVLDPRSLWAAALGLAGMIAINLDVFRFLAHKRGLWFALRAIPMHWLYFLYADLGFVLGRLLPRSAPSRVRPGKP